MKILLLFPPLWPAFMPYLALPSLTAYLRQQGYHVEQRDLNVETYKVLLSRGFLEDLAIQAKKRLGLLEGKDQLVDDELEEYRALCKADMVGDYVLRHAGWRHDALELGGRSLIEKGASQLWSAASYPAIVSAHHFQPSYCQSEGDLARAVLDEKQNPFRRIFREYFLDSIMDEQANLIGLSVMDYTQLIPAITLASLIRERDKDVHITAGGYVFTNHIDVLRRQKWLFDYLSSVIVFEGELPLLRLAETIEKGSDIERIPQLVYDGGEGVRYNPPEDLVPLNSLPAPVYDGFPIDSYMMPSMPLAASRGCYWGRCAFCNATYPFIRTRFRDADLVIEDIIKLNEEYDISRIAFNHPCVPPVLMKTLARGILDAGLDIQWISDARIDQRFTPELFQILAESGCVGLRWGVESGSNRMLKAMSKGTTAELSKMVLENSKQVGIHNHVYILVGFPSEKWRDVQQTLDFLVDNQDIIDELCIQTFELHPNSPVALEPADYGITSLAIDVLGGYEYTVEEGLSQEEAQQALLYLKHELMDIYPLPVLEGYVHPFLPSRADSVTLASSSQPITLAERGEWDDLYLSLKEGVFQRAFHFDKRGNEFEKDHWALYDLYGDRLYFMKRQVLEFLSDCETMSLEEVVAKLSVDYDLPTEEVRAICQNFVEELCRRRLVTLRER